MGFIIVYRYVKRKWVNVCYVDVCIYQDSYRHLRLHSCVKGFFTGDKNAFLS